MCLILVNHKNCYDNKLYRLLEQIWLLWVGASLVFAVWYTNIFVCICMPNTYSFIFMYNSYIIHRDKIYETKIKIQTKWKNKKKIKMARQTCHFILKRKRLQKIYKNIAQLLRLQKICCSHQRTNQQPDDKQPNLLQNRQNSRFQLVRRARGTEI